MPWPASGRSVQLVDRSVDPSRADARIPYPPLCARTWTRNAVVPEVVRPIGQVGAMAELAATGGPLVVFDADAGLARQGLMTPSRELEAYRIVQEALGNALRHGRARRIAMSAHLWPPDRLVLEVRDDGVGLTGQPRSRGLGLSGMQDRAMAMGAHLAITSVSGRGTAVRLTIPLAREVVDAVRPDAALQAQGSRS